MSGRHKVTRAELATILEGSLLDGVNTFRRVAGVDLRIAKASVDRFRAATLDWRVFLEPVEKCGHCDGTGFAKK